MARKTDIRLRRSATAGAIPTTGNLNLGELALNTYDGKLYAKTTEGSLDSVIQIGSATDSYHKVRKSLTLEFEVKVITKTTDHTLITFIFKSIFLSNFFICSCGLKILKYGAASTPLPAAHCQFPTLLAIS